MEREGALQGPFPFFDLRLEAFLKRFGGDPIMEHAGHPLAMMESELRTSGGFDGKRRFVIASGLQLPYTATVAFFTRRFAATHHLHGFAASGVYG